MSSLHGYSDYRGYEIYREQRYEYEQQKPYFYSSNEFIVERINDQLYAEGLGSVSRHAVRHYGTLERNGYQRFVSRRRYEAARSTRQGTHALANPRYPWVRSAIVGDLLLRYLDNELTIASNVVQISEAGLQIECSDEFASAMRAKLLGHSPNIGTFRDRETSREFIGRLTAMYHLPPRSQHERTLAAEFEFRMPQSLARISPRFASRVDFPGDLLLEFIARDAVPSFDLYSRQLRSFVELLESARGLYNNVIGWQPDAYLPPFALNEVSFSSPSRARVEANLNLSMKIGALLALIVGTLNQAGFIGSDSTVPVLDPPAPFEINIGEVNLSDSAIMSLDLDEAVNGIDAGGRESAPTDVAEHRLRQILARDIVKCLVDLNECGVDQIKYGIAD